MSEIPQAKGSPEEIEAVITELEQYRERIVSDVLQMAQRIKLSKKAAMEHLGNHPEIVRIDAALADLQAKQSSLR